MMMMPPPIYLRRVHPLISFMNQLHFFIKNLKQLFYFFLLFIYLNETKINLMIIYTSGRHLSFTENLQKEMTAANRFVQSISEWRMKKQKLPGY